MAQSLVRGPTVVLTYSALWVPWTSPLTHTPTPPPPPHTVGAAGGAGAQLQLHRRLAHRLQLLPAAAAKERPAHLRQPAVARQRRRQLAGNRGWRREEFIHVDSDSAPLCTYTASFFQITILMYNTQADIPGPGPIISAHCRRLPAGSLERVNYRQLIEVYAIITLVRRFNGSLGEARRRLETRLLTSFLL